MEMGCGQVDTTVLGLSAEDAKASPYIASMGIYVFKKSVLLKLLLDKFPTCNDFGSEVRLINVLSLQHHKATQACLALTRSVTEKQGVDEHEPGRGLMGLM